MAANRIRFAVEPTTESPANGRLIAVVGTPSDGDVPTWVDANQQYEPQPTSQVADIDDLSDVDTTTTTPGDGAFLVWRAASSAWRPAYATSDSSGNVLTDSSGNIVVSLT